MAIFDPSRLYISLQNTGLQQKDNPLYQVIRDLIGVDDKLGKQIDRLTASSSGSGGGGSSGAIGPQGPPGISGLDGIDGGDNYPPVFDITGFIPYVGANKNVDLGLFSLKTPLVIGGSAIGSSLSLQSTSGVGTVDYIKFLVGNNGATEAMRIVDNGTIPTVFIGTTNPLTYQANAPAVGFNAYFNDAVADNLYISTNFAARVRKNASGSLLFEMAPSGIAGANVTFTERISILTGGNVGFSTASPTAIVHIKAGTAVASSAPLKLTSGSLLTTAEAGAIEFLTDAFYATITTGAARKTFAFLESPIFTTPNIGVASGTSLTLTSFIQTGNGAVATPAFSFASNTGLGWYRPFANYMGFANGVGATTFLWGDVTQYLASTSLISWTTGAVNAAVDLTLSRSAAKTLKIDDGAAGAIVVNILGNLGISTAIPTARLHLPAGAAAANASPLKMTAGTLLTTPEIGAIEYTDDGTTAHIYATVRIATVATRVQLA